MTQPTAYTRSTAFAEDEASNVGGRSTVRTARVDAEFDAIALTISQLRANLAVIQRDDTALRDSVVGLHTLSSAVLGLLTSYGSTPRGPWVTATVYALKDLVESGGDTYICVTDHIAGTFATDLAADKWMLFSLGAAQSSSGIPFSPTATIAATNTQAAVEEVDTDLRALVAAASSATTTGDALIRSDLASDSSLSVGAGMIGFEPTRNYAARTLGWAQKKTAVSVNIFDGVDATGATTTSSALNTAIAFILALGCTPVLSGVYKIDTQITNTDDLLLAGEPGSVMRDWGNSPVSRVTSAGKGAVLNWVGSNIVPVVYFDSDLGSRFSLRDIAIVVGDSYATSIVKLKGSRWYSFTGKTPHWDIDGLALYRDSNAVTPGSSSSSGIEFDLTDTATPRAFFGVSVQRVYAYGLNQVYYVNSAVQVTAATGNWFNSNHLGETMAYKCYRIANLIAQSNAYDQISLNRFGPWFVQPAGDNNGFMATGILRMVANVNRNTFDTISIYDVVAGGTPRRVIHTNPYSATNQDTWNRFVNCPDLEIDSSFQMANIVDGRQITGGAAIGLTGVAAWLPEVQFAGSSAGVTYTVQLGRYVRQGGLVQVEIDITLNALGGAGAGSAVTITLPVDKAAGPSCPATVFMTNGAGSIYGVAGEIGAAAPVVTLYYYATSGSNAASTMTKAQVQTATTIRISAVYPART